MTTTASQPSPPQQTPVGPPPHGSTTPARGLARWCVEHRWRTLLAGLLVLAGAVVLLGGGLKPGAAADQLVGDSREAARISAGADFGTRPTENVVVTPRSGALSGADAVRIGHELAVTYSGVAGVHDVGRPVPAPDGRTLVLAVGLDAVSDPARAAGGTRRTAGDAVGPMLGPAAP